MKIESTAGEKFQKLVEIMARLRAPGGCPWDREQTFDTIKPYTLEETYEVLDAIDRRDWPDLAEELGDFMLQAVFYARDGRRRGPLRASTTRSTPSTRSWSAAIRTCSAMNPPKPPSDVKRIWGEVKPPRKESKGKPKTACWIGRAARAAGAGGGAADRFARRRRGLRLGKSRAGDREAARRAGRVRRGAPQRIAQAELEDELGDLLFVLVNLARFVKVDPEQALRKTNAKFRAALRLHRAQAGGAGQTPAKIPNIEEMEALWQEAKRGTPRTDDRDSASYSRSPSSKRSCNCSRPSGASTISICCRCGFWWW